MTVSRTLMSPDGPTVSRFIAGFWRLRDWGMSSQQLLRFVEENIELGVTTMDHALVYSSEALFGDAMALKPALREKMEIITKCGIHLAGAKECGAEKINHYDSRKESILSSVELSLANLRTDYIDVLLLHRPDFLMDGEEVAAAFSQLKEQGKVRHFGVSNFNVHQFDYLQHALGDEKLVTNQVELSPYHMHALGHGTLEQCARHGASPMLWSCLAGGKLLVPETDKGHRLADVLDNVAQEIGATAIEQVVYAWVLGLPYNPLPLLGTSKIERIKVAVEAEHLSLTQEQWYSIWQASNGQPVP